MIVSSGMTNKKRKRARIAKKGEAEQKKQKQNAATGKLESLFASSTLTHLKRSAGEPPSEYEPRLRVYLQHVHQLGVEKCEALAMIWRCVHYLGCRYEIEVEEQIDNWEIPAKSYVVKRQKENDAVNNKHQKKKKKGPKGATANHIVGTPMALPGTDKDKVIGKSLVKQKKKEEIVNENPYELLD